ncbi:hypothetical protein MRX96_008011 [Rhipicephalus microplus]
MLPRYATPAKGYQRWSSHYHDIVAWLSSVNNPSCGVAEDYRSASPTPRGPHQNATAFATRNAEACLRTLRGHFAPQFRSNHLFERRMFYNSVEQPHDRRHG